MNKIEKYTISEMLVKIEIQRLKDNEEELKKLKEEYFSSPKGEERKG